MERKHFEVDFEVIGEAPVSPMTREELREANKPYFDGLAEVIGKRGARKALNQYLDWLEHRYGRSVMIVRSGEIREVVDPKETSSGEGVTVFELGEIREVEPPKEFEQ